MSSLPPSPTKVDPRYVLALLVTVSGGGVYVHSQQADADVVTQAQADQLRHAQERYDDLMLQCLRKP